MKGHMCTLDAQKTESTIVFFINFEKDDYFVFQKVLPKSSKCLLSAFLKDLHFNGDAVLV
jgi:hypothetical protein